MNPTALRRMALHVDEQHRSAMKELPERLHELHFGATARQIAPSRRRFLGHAAATGAVVAVGGVLLPVTALVPAALAQESESTVPEGDAELAIFAASVERAAVAAYEAAAARKLIEEPTLQTALLFASHHAEHAGAFEALIAEVTGEDAEEADPNAALLDVFGPQIEAATDATGLLTIAFQLEQAAASTYQFAMGVLESADAAAAVATIEPVEAQHAVVLGMALELPLDVPQDDPNQWMPAFESADQALDPEEYPVG